MIERMDHLPDLLSDLPLSIIHIILAHIPLKDAIRTSVLSRQWRYTWASLPHLVFEEFCPDRNDEPIHKFEERVKTAITHVLFRHQGPIHKLKMSIFSESFFPDVDEWVLHLSRNDIKELILVMGSPDHHCSQQAHIYSCEKLTNLELHNFDLDPPPSSFKGFLFLRRLSLRDVYLSSSGIEALVANSPLLEDFTLDDIGYSDVTMLRISAPNLKSLYLSGQYLEICLNTPILAEVTVSNVYVFTAIQLQQKSSVCNYTNFFGGLANLEKLCGIINFIEYLSIGMESCRRTLMFHHLKEIEISSVNFEDIKQISVVARLVIGAPNLQELKISTDLDSRADEALYSESPEVCFSDFGCAPDFRFEKLSFVVMDYISGFPSQVDFMVFLLERSPVLETMIVDHSCAADDLEKKILMARLVSCDWANPDAELATPIC